MSKTRQGLMMRDLLVLITLVAIAVPIIVLILPQRAYREDYRTVIGNNLKQLTLAMHAFNDVYKRLPPATGTFGAVKISK